MTGTKRLVPIYRVSVFTPPDALDALLESVLRITALGEEHYDCVHWVVRDCSEYFRPLTGANPASGVIGKLHEEPSVLLVFAIPRDEELLQQVLEDGIRAAHPWEVPAIFVDESLRPSA